MFEIIVVYLKLASGEVENENNRENASAVHFHDSKLAKPYVLKGPYEKQYRKWNPDQFCIVFGIGPFETLVQRRSLASPEESIVFLNILIFF